MRLGGHETFSLRPGWLAKGLQRLREPDPGTFSSPDVADALGVGRNMAKSIGWWLQTAGLAKRAGQSLPLEPSGFGRVVAERDPFMTRLGTWWLIHAAALTSHADSSLPLFFSAHGPERSDRAAIVEGLYAMLEHGKGRAPARKTVQREVSAVLQSYAVPVPRPAGDPEDNLGSPLQRLELYRHVRTTDRFERTEPTPAPPEALGLVLSALEMDAPSHGLDEGRKLSIPVAGDAVARAGAILGRNRDAVLGLASEGAKVLGKARMDVRALAGERVVTLTSARAATWAQSFYDRMDDMARGMAA